MAFNYRTTKVGSKGRESASSRNVVAKKGYFTEPEDASAARLLARDRTEGVWSYRRGCKVTISALVSRMNFTALINDRSCITYVSHSGRTILNFPCFSLAPNCCEAFVTHTRNIALVIGVHAAYHGSYRPPDPSFRPFLTEKEIESSNRMRYSLIGAMAGRIMAVLSRSVAC